MWKNAANGQPLFVATPKSPFDAHLAHNTTLTAVCHPPTSCFRPPAAIRTCCGPALPRPPIHDAHLSPMSRFARILAFIILCAVVGLAAAFVIGLLWPGTGQLLRTRLGLTP